MNALQAIKKKVTKLYKSIRVEQKHPQKAKWGFQLVTMVTVVA